MKLQEPKILTEGNKVFSFIGYEPDNIGGFDNEDSLINNWVKFSLKVMVSHLSKIHQNAVFMSGCSPGTETWASEEVVNIRKHHPERNIRLLVVLPCPNLSGRSANGKPTTSRPWPTKSHDRMMKIIESADNSIVLDKGYLSALKMRDRDRWVVERSYGSLFVSDVYNKSTRVSEAMAFAESVGSQRCIIDPTSEKIYVL